MKYLPCSFPKCPGPSLVPASQRRGLAALPGGVPYVLGVPPMETIRYTCAACKRSTRLSIPEWHALPTRRLVDLEAAKMGDIVLRDLAGIGIDRAQALQLEAAGVSFDEVHRMPRRFPKGEEAPPA